MSCNLSIITKNCITTPTAPLFASIVCLADAPPPLFAGAAPSAAKLDGCERVLRKRDQSSTGTVTVQAHTQHEADGAWSSQRPRQTQQRHIACRVPLVMQALMLMQCTCTCTPQAQIFAGFEAPRTRATAASNPQTNATLVNAQ